MELLKRLIVVGFALSAISYYALSDRASQAVLAYGSTPPGPPLLRTGAPGEGDCTGCHYTYEPANSNPAGAVRITGLPANYTPGQTYTVSVMVSLATARRWGFELTALDANGASSTIGNLNITDSSATTKRNGTDTGKLRTYISHTPDGTSQGQASSNSWSFTWTAPSSSSGDVTFYAAGNAADGTETPEYDYIFTTLALVKAPAPIVAAQSLVGMSSYLDFSGATTVDLKARGNFDMGAKIIFNGVEMPTQSVPDGLTATIPANLLGSKGAYPVRVKLGNGQLTNTRSFVLASGMNPNTAVTVDAASYTRAVAPGQIVALFGTNLVMGSGSASATAIPLPRSLQNTTVYVNGVAAPLFFTSNGQINCQIPYETAIGEATIVIMRDDGVISRGTVNIYPAWPAIFTANFSGSGQAIAQNSDYSINGDPGANPQAKRAKKGDYVILYGSGTGAQMVDASTRQPLTLRDGEAATSNPLAVTAIDPVITIGGKAATVYFSGLAPGLVSLWQLNVQVPADAPSGPSVDVVIKLGNGTSKTVTIAVE